MSRQRLRSGRRAKRIELRSRPGGPRPAAGRRKLEMDQPNFFGDYDTLIELVRNRVSVRNLKPDPIPDEYVDKILEIGRWAMSGANGQPWEFVVVKDPKKVLFDFRVLHHHEFPRLPVGAGHRPASDLENLIDIFVRNRVRLEPAHADPVAYEYVDKIL